VADPQLQAEILNQALPYIQAFRGQTFVVKYGGSAMRDPALMRGVIRNVLLLQLVGIKPILVHGGGPEIDRWLERIGLEKRTVDGLRVTDDETMEVVEMALGRANKALVAEIGEAGGKAVGLSGRDSGLLVADPISAELGRVGEVSEVNPQVLDVVSAEGLIPVVCSVAQGRDGGPLNINADSAASAIAAKLGASKLILLTDTDGVLEDKNDPETRISTLDPAAAKRMIDEGQADRGMIPKLEAAVKAVKAGVRAVHLINGATPNALLIEVFTDLGIGTMMVQRK
jgi:acetylglutamate kinase